MRILLLSLLSCWAVLAQTANEPLQLSWTNNMLRISGRQVPGDYVEIWFLEAFCRSGSTDRKWDLTTIPHKTELLESSPHKLRLRTKVEPSVVVDHLITATVDEVNFQDTARNEGSDFVDVQWYQPCIRLGRFTGASQADYIGKSFIFTKEGLQILSKLPWAEDAVYRGGQVWVPEGIPMEDVNPRPVSRVRPAKGLIGCFSADNKKLLAAACDRTQELFQGVAICLHNDPRIGGLKAGETQKIHSKIYILENDPAALLRRYEADFRRKN